MLWTATVITRPGCQIPSLRRLASATAQNLCPTAGLTKRLQKSKCGLLDKILNV
jgi:hypothetical protein